MRGLAKVVVASLGCAVLALAGDRVLAQEDPKNHYILECGEACPKVAGDAPIGAPHGIATDTRGNVYFTSQNIVFKLSRSGALSVVAGTGEPGYSGDGGLATLATLHMPESYPEMEDDPWDYYPLHGGIAVDGSGNVFVADVYNSRIRRIGADATISTVADETGAPIALRWPSGVLVDGGALVVASVYGSIVRRAADGVVEKLAGCNCGEGFLGDGACVPQGIARDAGGALYFGDVYCRVRRWMPGTGASTIAGRDDRYEEGPWPCGFAGDGGPARDAKLSSLLYGVATDAAGVVYVADSANHCIRAIDPGGTIRTAAGFCGVRTNGDTLGDGGVAPGGTLSFPMGVAVDADGNLYIADAGNRRIRKVGTDGIIWTVAGNGGPLP